MGAYHLPDLRIQKWRVPNLLECDALVRTASEHGRLVHGRLQPCVLQWRPPGVAQQRGSSCKNSRQLSSAGPAATHI